MRLLVTFTEDVDPAEIKGMLSSSYPVRAVTDIDGKPAGVLPVLSIGDMVQLEQAQVAHLTECGIATSEDVSRFTALEVWRAFRGMPTVLLHFGHLNRFMAEQGYFYWKGEVPHSPSVEAFEPYFEESLCRLLARSGLWPALLRQMTDADVRRIYGVGPLLRQPLLEWVQGQRQ